MFNRSEVIPGKMKAVSVFLLIFAGFLLLLVGYFFASSGQKFEYPEFEFKIFGAESLETVRVDHEKISYTLQRPDGAVLRQLEKQISAEQYNSVLQAFTVNDFVGLDSRYSSSLPAEQKLELKMTSSGKTKLVQVDASEDLPEKLKSVVSVMLSARSFASQITEDQAMELATAYVKASPTFAYDGQNLVLNSSVLMQAAPQQYLVIFDYISSHGGFGNRAGMVVTSALTPHRILVRVTDGRVVSAVVDGRWDEFLQQEVNSTI